MTRHTSRRSKLIPRRYAGQPTHCIGLMFRQPGSTRTSKIACIGVHLQTARLGGSQGRSVAPPGSRDFVRGSMASSPFTPGEAWMH